MEVVSDLGFAKALCHSFCVLFACVFLIQFETAASWDTPATAPAFVPSLLAPEELNG
ncbi:hypothetical protein TRIATDRAFT_160920 [Trichoderma atroviride IMI 206040]|uniref:Uncharacterized protein n=1 Tax=Hypocrea atroviridis (strain ATCC 20476 / IMI 206040) TaxID=452589 RepID=G9NKX8_HYPAI|nr:uncharacterized protein TRIATDRAFT_160920 [Trichoderma atroviride IMI 206040]EHK48548.1 hypothetical protein TRIATDRAFT_160920 [Trichoderma atroviride IMI 206040]